MLRKPLDKIIAVLMELAYRISNKKALLVPHERASCSEMRPERYWRMKRSLVVGLFTP